MIIPNRWIALTIALVFCLSFLLSAGAGPLQRLEELEFGKTADGAVVRLFILRNAGGMTAKIMTYGATITELQAPDQQGNFTNVVLGASDFAAYRRGFNAAGSIMGRVANRISQARFTLDGVEYKLAANNGRHHIHGGPHGFGQVNWTGRALPEGPHESGVEFTYFSKDGEEGYPGNLTVKVIYTLNDHGDLRLNYEAVTDKATPVNLTTHTYFNLAGGGDCLNNVLWLAADRYTLADDELIPTGEFASVKGTPMDFTKGERIGARIEQLKPRMNGYDHNFLLAGDGKQPVLAARVTDPASGRVMEVRTTQPAVQLYTGNHLRHGGLALETQHYPDSINHPAFPSIVLRPGQTQRSTTIFTFLVP